MAIVVAFGTSWAGTLGLFEVEVWWELATLITIMLLGHWLEMSAVMGAQNALGELAALIPDEAEIVDGDSTRTVAASELAVGDRIVVRPGSAIPADGTVVDGESDVDESLLTTLNLTRQVNVNYDEIRIGESLSDVFLAGPGPVELKITSIQQIDDGLFELTLKGLPNTAYELMSSDDLDFLNGSGVSAITQGEASDPGTISGPDNSIVTPDEDGIATVQITLATGTRGFVRARESK
jgi:hypothetical protein